MKDQMDNVMEAQEIILDIRGGLTALEMMVDADGFNKYNDGDNAYAWVLDHLRRDVKDANDLLSEATSKAG